MLKAVILDAATMGEGLDWSPIADLVAELNVYPATSPEQLLEHLGDAELILTNKVVIPAEVMPGRKAICVLATGTNVVDMDAAKALGLPVLNVENYGADYVAQHTLMLILALAGKLPLYQRDIAAGQWQQSPMFCLLQHSTLSLAGKQLVLVGSGHIGNQVATVARALGMTVTFAARPGAASDSRPALAELVTRADVLSFHCPLNDHTRHLLNEQLLAEIKPGCLVVNCARGGVIDELACLAALQTGRIGGLAVDVLPVEPPQEGHPLLDALAEPLNIKPLNLIVTPHNAWISPEARQRIIDLTADNIRKI